MNRPSHSHFRIVKLPLAILFTALVTQLGLIRAQAQSSAFTYQGRLSQNSAPASGNFDLTFTLKSALTGGATIGTPITKPNVSIEDGVFTTQIDFGATAFSGGDRWLEIEVDGTTLPRQPLTPAPLALGLPNVFTSSGNVGIGTDDPSSPLHLSSTGSVDLLIEADSDNFDESDHPTLTFSQDGGGATARLGMARGANDFRIETTLGGTFNRALAIDPVNGNIRIIDPDLGGVLSVNGPVFSSAPGNTPAGSYIALTGPANNPGVTIVRGDSGKRWDTSVVADGTYTIAEAGVATQLRVHPGGNVTIGTGSATNTEKFSVNGNVKCTTAIITSDRNKKDGFEPVDPREVLDKVAAMPITKWHYKTDTGVDHIGLVAQDFHEAFGLGRDNLHIATVDADGIALAAIQGLSQRSEEKDAKIEALEKRLEALEKALEKALAPPAGLTQ